MSLQEKSLMVQKWLSAILLVVGVLLLVTTYQDIFIPSPTLSFNLGLLSLGLYIIHLFRKEKSRIKEITLLSTIAFYIILMISSFIYKIWSYETIFTKNGITRMTIFVLLFLSAYLIIAYVRAKINYKQVKGNQRHNEAWHVTKKDMKNMMESDDIYIQLGIYHKENKNE